MTEATVTDGNMATPTVRDNQLRELVRPGAGACVVVIDVQNDFCAEGGWYAKAGYDLSAIQAAVDRLGGFLDEARAVSIPVIFVRAIYDEEFLSPAMRRRQERRGLPLAHCQTGTWGAEQYRVAPRDSELLLTKHRYSALLDTELSSTLRARGLTTLILTGVSSNVCVETTARDAFMSDYDVIFLSDCTASYDSRLHEATLENIERSFGIVASSKELEELWRH